MKIRLALFLYIFVLLPPAAHGAEDARPKIAVTDLTARAGVSQDVATMMAETLRSEMFALGSYDVVNREDMVMILKEISFQQSGACDTTTCAVEMGQALGVEKMVAGSVGKLGDTYVLHLKLVDIATTRNEKLVTKEHRGGLAKLLDVVRAAALELNSDAPRARRQSLILSSRFLLGIRGGYQFGGVPVAPLPNTTNNGGEAHGPGGGIIFEYQATDKIILALQGAGFMGSDDSGLLKTITAEGMLTVRYLFTRSIKKPYVGLGLGIARIEVTDNDVSLAGSRGIIINSTHPIFEVGVVIAQTKTFEIPFQWSFIKLNVDEGGGGLFRLQTGISFFL